MAASTRCAAVADCTFYAIDDTDLAQGVPYQPPG
jgi:hypothetical protein